MPQIVILFSKICHFEFIFSYYLKICHFELIYDRLYLHYIKGNSMLFRMDFKGDYRAWYGLVRGIPFEWTGDRGLTLLHSQSINT